MQKTVTKLPTVLLFVIYGLYAALITPLTEYVGTDVVLQNTLLYDFLDFFYHLFEALGISVAFGILIHGVYAFGVKACGRLYLITGGALLLKYIGSLIAISIMRGSLDLTADYTSIIVGFCIEVAECALAVFLAYKLASNVTEPPIPYKSIFSRTNPLQRVAFWSVVTMAVFRLASFLIADISFAIIFSIGYTFVDVLVLFIYAILLFLIPAFIGYLLSLNIMRHAERARTANE